MLQPKFDAVSSTPAPRGPSVGPMWDKSDADELNAWRLESVKRLFLFLNWRLERDIEQWKAWKRDKTSC